MLLDHSSALGTTDPLPSIAAESVAKSPKSLIWPRKTALLWAQEAKGMSSAASPPYLFFSVPAPPALRTPLALCSPLILHWTIRMDFTALHLSESRPGSARVVPTTGGEHLSIRSRAVTGSPITSKANFNSPNQGSSRVVIVDSYKDIE
ncbi:hypothetical protein GQ457_15G021190 [Hibiscus cannabinus]